MKVLITGVAGLVGSHLAEYYARKGASVYGVDNLMRSRLFKSKHKSVEYNWEYLSKYKNISRIYGDVRDKKFLEDIFQGNKFELVIHTAAQPGVGFSIQNPEEDFYINALGTFNLLECTREHSPSATFIYCSTNKVYGENVSQFELEETETRYSFKQIKGIDENLDIDLTAHTPYGVSKYVGDIYAQEYGKSFGLRTVVFRMSCIYGTRQFGFEDQGWLAWFLIASLTGKKITIYGDGKQVRDVLYVEDLVSAFDSFHNSALGSEVFNIGGGPENTVSLLEYLTLLEQKLKLKIEKEYSDWRPSDQKVYISNIDKLKAKLNWHPRIVLEEGLEHLLSWAKANIDLFG